MGSNHKNTSRNKGTIITTIKIIKIIKRILLSAMCALILLPWASFGSAAERGTKEVRVGWYDTGRDEKIGENTGSHGYYYEYLQALRQYTHWKYSYVRGSWDQCMDMLAKGTIDLLGFVHKSAARERIYGYTELPMALSAGILVTLGEDERLGYGEYSAFNGITVGVYKSNGFNEDFEEYCRRRNVSVTYRTYDSLVELLAALEQKFLDAAVLADEDKDPSLRVIAKFAPQKQYFVTSSKNQKFLEELNEAMFDVNAFVPNLNADLARKYWSTGVGGTPLFTAEEQRFIKDHPTILVMYDAGWQPIEYFSEKTRRYEGVGPALFRLLGERSGIRFAADGDVSTSGETLARLAEREPENQLSTISYDYYWADRHNVRITQPFFTSAIVKVGRNFDAPSPVVAVNQKAYFTYLMRGDLQRCTAMHFDRQAERFDAVLEGRADYTYCTEAQANYYLSLPKYRKLKAQEVPGFEQKVCISISKNSSPALMTILSKCLASISSDEMAEIIRKNADVRYEPTMTDFFYLYPVASVAAAGLMLLFIVIAAAQVKISRLKRIASEKANQAKSQFLSQMSHDMRTPLNSILGMTYLALGVEGLPRRAQSYMKKVSISGKYLLSLINDVLDMSAIESGKLKIVSAPFDFKQLILSLSSVYFSQCQAKKVDFEVRILNCLDERLIGDQLRLNQVLMNLLSNAAKFTDRGHIWLTMEQRSEQKDRAVIRFTVTDTGCGISEEMLSRLFSPFEQESSETALKHGGSGLGLSIVKNLLAMMKGTIQVQSKKGEGTTFVVDLPFERCLDRSLRNEFSVPDVRVLVLDEDAASLNCVTSVFSWIGVRFTRVGAEDEAMAELAAAAEAHDAYKICFIDWSVFQHKGLEVCRRIRSVYSRDVLLIVALAYDLALADSETQAAGADLAIIKPLFQSTIFDLFMSLPGRRLVRESKAAQSCDLSGRRVLLAEDNEMNRIVAAGLLGKAGVVCDTANNGKLALERFLSAKPGTYDAILMDIQMPVMNGYEAAQAIRASDHPEAATIPIVAMTADAFIEDITRALASGMNNHVSKPIELDALLSALDQAIKNRRLMK